MPAKSARRKRTKVTLLPTVRPTPPPPPRKARPKPVYCCNSGEKCPAYLEFGKAEKIRTTKGAKGYCDRCLTRRGEEATKDLKARRAGGAPRTATA